jgi:hypothetical protein
LLLLQVNRLTAAHAFKAKDKEENRHTDKQIYRQ